MPRPEGKVWFSEGDTVYLGGNWYKIIAITVGPWRMKKAVRIPGETPEA